MAAADSPSPSPVGAPAQQQQQQQSSTHPEPALVLSERAKPVSASAAAAAPTIITEEIGLAPRRTHTVENVDGLPGLSVVQSHSSFIDFPPGIFPPTDRPGTADIIAVDLLTTTATTKQPANDSESGTPSPTTPPDEWEVYNRFPRSRKIFMSILMSYCGMLSSISSTAVLAALPEVSAEYAVGGGVVSLSNAICLVFMGLGPCFWGPASQNWGRRLVVLAIAVVFTAGSVGTALAPNLAAFFVFRIVTSFAGLSFQVIGSAIIGDIYHPTERATGLGWYLIGPLVGPSVAPFMGSVVITLAPWRAIFWVQAVMGGLALVLIFAFLPETLVHFPRRRIGWWLLATPVGMVKLFRYPNLVCVAVTSGALIWNSYSLLTPIRYVLNPRFNLTSPLQSGLFFLAPGVGNVVGAAFGTRWADVTVRRWIRKRGGHTRVPEDRLRAGLLAMGVLLPASVLVYGWSVEKAVGGIPVPAVFMVLQGVGQMIVFPTIDTYCMDVYQSRAAETLGGNFMIKFWFGAAGSAVVIPTVDAIGVGWFSTITAALLVIGACTAAMAAIWGPKWRASVDEKLAAREEARRAVVVVIEQDKETKDRKVNKRGDQDDDDKKQIASEKVLECEKS